MALPAAAQGTADAKRGQYLSKAAGCIGCHTESAPGAPPYAGGREIKTEFGAFFGPNITPDPEAGIGRWSERDFVGAMRLGVRPDGSNLYPVFPYPSFTRISDQDLADLWAYLRTLPASNRPSRAHELKFPFNQRWLLTAWKWLYFSPGRFVPDPRHSAAVNRGAYLVNALGHCGECHTPRGPLGGSKSAEHLAGGRLPDGKRVPNLTPTRLKDLTDAELKDFLVTGITPDGDVAAESMAEVVRNTTSQLTRPDLDALVAYLRSLPALPNATK